MKHHILSLAGFLLVIAFSSTTASAVDIMVSPSTLYLESEGTWVTVHADIPYGAVVSASVELNGIAVDWTKADNQGDLVAKFELDTVKGIVAPPSATLTLSGTTIDGSTFSGTDTVKVVAPKKRK